MSESSPRPAGWADPDSGGRSSSSSRDAEFLGTSSTSLFEADGVHDRASSGRVGRSRDSDQDRLVVTVGTGVPVETQDCVAGTMVRRATGEENARSRDGPSTKTDDWSAPETGWVEGLVRKGIPGEEWNAPQTFPECIDTRQQSRRTAMTCHRRTIADGRPYREFVRLRALVMVVAVHTRELAKFGSAALDGIWLRMSGGRRRFLDCDLQLPS